MAQTSLPFTIWSDFLDQKDEALNISGLSFSVVLDTICKNQNYSRFIPSKVSWYFLSKNIWERLFISNITPLRAVGDEEAV